MLVASKRYTRLFDQYYTELFSQRLDDTSDAIGDYLKSIIAPHFEYEDWNVILDLCPTKLSHLVKSYFYDVIRYKEFHFSPESDLPEDQEKIHLALTSGGRHINDPKQIAYLVKWITKVKPISIIFLCANESLRNGADGPNLTAKQEELIAAINEYFAVHLALSFFKLSYQDLGNVEVERLVYQLHYRPFEEGAFERIFEQWAA